MRLRPVLHAVGLMTAGLGLAMVPPAAIDRFDSDGQWRSFALLAALTITCGTLVATATWRKYDPVRVHEGFVLTVSIWSVLAAVAALPFLFHGLTPTNAVFESMSGLTTTGATVMTGLDQTSRGILLWRALLQWIGGIGIIVTAIAVLPMLRIGGMQIFQLESSDASGKFLPSVSEIASQTALVYGALTAICALLYTQSGMSIFNAVAHSFTTVSAGGFSTSDRSMSAFTSGQADLVALVFMLLAALPFSLMVLAIRGQIRPLVTDPQPRTMCLVAAVASCAVALALMAGQPDTDTPTLWRQAVFNTVSVLTGTGYATADFAQWGSFATSILLVTMFCGGCAGSAACGMKIFRVHIGCLAVFAHARYLATPHRVTPVHYGDRVIGAQTLHSILFFILLYLASFATFAAALALTGLDPHTALSGAAACLSNVGPGLGNTIGPTGNYQSLPDTAKWLCTIAMLVGRLELLTAFMLLNPRFWRL